MPFGICKCNYNLGIHSANVYTMGRRRRRSSSSSEYGGSSEDERVFIEGVRTVVHGAAKAMGGAKDDAGPVASVLKSALKQADKQLKQTWKTPVDESYHYIQDTPKLGSKTKTNLIFLCYSITVRWCISSVSLLKVISLTTVLQHN